MIAAVGTVAGVLLVDVESEAVLGEGTEVPAVERPPVDLPRVVAAARAGSTVVVVVERRPPLLLSNDGGATWREAGGGLPPASPSRSPRTTPTGCSTPPATASTSR